MAGPLTAGQAFQDIARVAIDPGSGQVYEHGWQSWSPSTTYEAGDRPHRPSSERTRVMNHRPDRSVPDGVFQGEGLLAVQEHAGGPVHVFAVEPGADTVPSVRARVGRGAVVVAGDGAVQHTVDHGRGGIAGALGRWADGYAAALGVGPTRPAPTVWCSWYHYFTAVTEPDMLENLDAIGELDLPIEVVQLDDGYQAGLGDWLTLSGRFRSLQELVDRIRDQGRRAGIWTAPFLAGERSQLSADHRDWLTLSGRFRSLQELVDRIRDQGRRAGIWTAPFLAGERSQLCADHRDWLVEGASAGHNWGQDLYALDVTHPGAADYLQRVFSSFRELGIDYFKIDFVYAGAMDGRRHQQLPPVEAYRLGLRLIREAIGPDAYLLGCGAPILPSVGLVDAMRVGPDVAPEYDPPDGDLSQPSQRSAALNVAGRAWQHGRFWVNDPDCLIARPEVERREEWATVIERFGGLRGSSDRLHSLDEWGLQTTRRLLSTVPPPAPFVLDTGEGNDR
jgi:alpha-galactosidase